MLARDHWRFPFDQNEYIYASRNPHNRPRRWASVQFWALPGTDSRSRCSPHIPWRERYYWEKRALGKSALKDMVNDVRALSSWAQSKGVKVLTCDIITRETKLVGTDLSNKRLLKRFKKRHLTIRYFAFKMLSDGVHLENYADLW